MSGWPYDRARDGGIDEVAVPGVSGRLWLCGKHAIGPNPQRLLESVGAVTVVCLTQEHELSERYPGYVAWLHANRGVTAVWFPIPDLDAPPVTEVRALVEEIRARLDSGENIVVHCAAGIGRAGTIATCLLVAMGQPLDAALRHVAASRPMAGPEVGAQRALVEAFAQSN